MQGRPAGRRSGRHFQEYGAKRTRMALSLNDQKVCGWLRVVEVGMWVIFVVF